ncbi:MAG: tRNA uridine-5-carboxymethylaminomethyl(34) synthesis GTPase MnmE [Clostridia bacterium]|nr:tRNA uridine-5-carboxymethylaminomethyl(34) synthesis GTPase MnmE [Clostridia bacterium]
MQPIAQISTPLGSGGIAVIRMSGEKSLDIALSLFSAKNLTQQNIVPRHLYYGTFCNNEIKEKCLMAYFKAPFSFTGEDVVEFQVHGGEYLATFILKSLLAHGARLAENGEFSKLAFINGKLSLDEAEATIDMINATSESELKASSKLLCGELFSVIKNAQQKIQDAIVDLEVSIDYPEHDDEVMSIENVCSTLKQVRADIEKLAASHMSGKVIKNGISVAIVGKPNVGKSSLLNALIGEDVAIVTEVQGTTRDIVKETITYNGIKLNFLDTAGVRESDDVVEKIGIEKSLDAINMCDVVVAVFDASNPLDEKDAKILTLTENKNTIYVQNKCDISVSPFVKPAIQISALTKQNINKIKDEILAYAKAKNINYDSLIITNERHNQALVEAMEVLDEAILACKTQTADIVDLLAKSVWKTLGKITGESEVENIIDAIFSKFCLGK